MNQDTVNYQQLIRLSVALGTGLMKNGAEVYRVEESMQRILYAYGVKRADVFAIPSLLIVSIESPEGKSYTKINRLYHNSINFEKISKLNDLARKIGTAPIDIEIALECVEEIVKEEGFSKKKIFLSYGLIAFSFAFLFNGGFPEAFIAAIAVYIGRLVCMPLEKHHVNGFFVILMASFIHTTIAFFFAHYINTIQLDAVISASLMVLVPGLAFMTAVRDIIARDLVAGLVEFMDVIVVSGAIAVGSAMSYAVLPLMMGVLG